MDILKITGGVPLQGTIPISGAKNAALPLMAVALLTDELLSLQMCPDLADITTMGDLLQTLGVVQDRQEGTLSLQCSHITNSSAPYELVRKMRASILVLGALLGRHGAASVSLPGGCAIGTRPVDLHLKAMEALGATIILEGGYIHATAPSGLRGGTIAFPFVSVGATENAILAAVLASGDTTITNAAREPEVLDLVLCLNAMGARIEGGGTSTLNIQGVPRLRGTRHTVLPDRIEAGTYMIAAAMTGGKVRLTGALKGSLDTFISKLIEAGVAVTTTKEYIEITADIKHLSGVDVLTEPYPGFPTDLQAQFMALMSVSKGAAMMTETIFENRFMHIPELCRMGAKIAVHHASALVRGVPHLQGAPVMATDLRASGCLVLGALAAVGTSTIHRVYHLDRGYERLTEKLMRCGAIIERVAA
jgi:UDP-N-acetylglucosamine 1-carboxyvinyltransferase